MTNPKGLPRASHSGRMLLGDAAVFVHVLPGGAAIVEAATVEALLGLPESGLGAFLASLPGTDRVTFLRSRESCSMCKAPASHYVRETSAKVCGKHRTWSEKRGIGTREWSGRDVQAVGVPAEKMSDMLISFWQANNGTPEGNRARDIVRAVVKRGMRASGHSEAPLDFLMAAATPPRPKLTAPEPTAWTCHAKPAATGKTCGHLNAAGIHYNGNLCCEACGCTKVASDAREKT